MKMIRNHIFNKIEQPLPLLVLFSAIFIVLILVVIQKTQSQQQSLKPYDSQAQFQFVRLNTTTALCLDGSPGAYYISKDGDPNQILLFFEGGGWCNGKDIKQTLEDCYFRSKTSKGSTVFHPQKHFLKINQGILSKDPRNNFKDWKKVMFLYCDGSGHQGTKLEPIQVKDSRLYFRGYNLTVQRLDDLQKRFGLFSKASQIVVSGCSAGGLAAFHWANYITERVKNGKVRVVADSGIFYDSYHVKTQSPLLRQYYKTLMEIVNKQIDLPVPQCLKANRLEQQRCMFAQNIIGEIKAPVFTIQGLYDQWSVQNILGIKCLNNYQLRRCSPIERYNMEQNRRNVVSVLTEMKNNQKNGAWAPSCSLHCFTTSSAYYDDNFRIPSKSQNSVSFAVQKWLQNLTSSHFSIDEESWPSNTRCSGTNNFI